MSVRVPRKHVHRSDVLCDVVDAEEAEKRERESSVLFSSLLSSGTTAMRELVGLEPARGSEQDTYADFSESAKNAVEKLMIGQLSSDADSILEVTWQLTWCM